MFYVDDVVVLSYWGQQEMENIIWILYCFYFTSVVKLNINKSNLCGVFVTNEEVSDMASITECAPGSWPLFNLEFPLV